jgi:uncharacterized protein (TIGR02996 family)
MTDGNALLAVIIANPDDDTPRLVYADWLQENGQPERTEFIRLQIERERLTPADPRFAVITRREQILYAHNKARWRLPLQLMMRGR